MVWVSNRSADDITVTITNASGGNGGPFVVQNAVVVENFGANNWIRSGQEVMTVARLGAADQVVTVNPSDFVRVTADTIIISQATVLQNN